MKTSNFVFKRMHRLAAYLVLPLAFSACSGISFYQSPKLNPEIKTVMVESFTSTATNSPANLEITFTEKLKQFFQRNTKLLIINSEADLKYTGNIDSYIIAPVSASGGNVQQATTQQIKISIAVSFENFKEDKSFEKVFSFFETFNANQNISDVENELIEKIFDQIINDIFNESVGDW